MFAERGGSRRLQQNTRSCPGRENNPYCGAAAGCWWAMVTPWDVGKEPSNPPVLRNKLESGVPSAPWQSPSPAGGSAPMAAQLLARRTRGAVGSGRGGCLGSCCQPQHGLQRAHLALLCGTGQLCVGQAHQGISDGSTEGLVPGVSSPPAPAGRAQRCPEIYGMLKTGQNEGKTPAPEGCLPTQTASSA